MGFTACRKLTPNAYLLARAAIDHFSERPRMALPNNVARQAQPRLIKTGNHLRSFQFTH
jgi:hypothetical protein